MCITKACEEPTGEGVWWRDDAEWRQYDAAQAAAIQGAIRDGAKSVHLGNLTSSKSARGASYVVNLTTMKQLNLATGYTGDVKIVVNSPAGNSVNSSDLIATLIEEVRGCHEAMHSLKQKVEKLEADYLAFKLPAAKSEANPAISNSGFGAGYNDSDRESCEPAWEYSPDFSSDDDYWDDDY